MPSRTHSLPAVDHVKPNGCTSLWTADDLAERWQVSKAHVYRLAREGSVPVVRIGRYFRFRPASIEQWEAASEGLTDE